MEKKNYSAPKVKKVDLTIRSAVLAVCHSSTTNQPQDEPLPGLGCGTNNCFIPGNVN